MPSCRSCATLRWVAGFAHICRFIAGATNSGHSRARQSVVSRSSARPCASLARKSADAGATTMASAPRDTAMWPMPSAAPDCHRSVRTGRPDSAWNVVGVTKRVAASVITTSTSTPAFTNRRVSSAALYAAMPPVTPSTTRSSRCWAFPEVVGAFIGISAIRTMGTGWAAKFTLPRSRVSRRDARRQTAAER